MDALMQEECKAVRGGVYDFRKHLSNEFKTVRSDIAVLSERLTRVETLFERDVDQPADLDMDAQPPPSPARAPRHGRTNRMPQMG